MASIFKDRRNRLLEGLAASDFALLAPHLKTVSLQQGLLIQEAGEPIEFVYFPHSGMISLLVVMRDGGGIETATIGREGAVNAIAALGGRISSGRKVVQVAGDIAQIPAVKLRAAAEASSTLRDVFVRYVDLHIALVQQTTGCNALHNVESRLCRWLLQTHDRCDSDTIPITQEFMAEMLGVQRTSVTAIASALQSQGLISYKRGRVEVLNRAGLEKKSCECYETVRRRSEEFFL